MPGIAFVALAASWWATEFPSMHHQGIMEAYVHKRSGGIMLHGKVPTGNLSELSGGAPRQSQVSHAQGAPPHTDANPAHKPHIAWELIG